ncbi:MAG: two component transcriptional regulator, LuxR family [Candidatus Acidoferrum typicum]|nr:two component transcriptional regulator, LuxR family [Candidatus Acidoferrum typicum]
MPKRILIVEDEASVRRAIHAFLEHHHFEICGEAAAGAEALEKAATLHPDLIVLDLSMPGMNGIEAASMLKTRAPSIPVVIYTMLQDSLGKSLSASLGVKAVVSKSDGLPKLLACIEAILESDASDSPDTRPHIGD